LCRRALGTEARVAAGTPPARDALWVPAAASGTRRGSWRRGFKGRRLRRERERDERRRGWSRYGSGEVELEDGLLLGRWFERGVVEKDRGLVAGLV
jgi:hypothetical protein